jgi:glycosyltransferase involved in cell wall biosynthesis
MKGGREIMGYFMNFSVIIPLYNKQNHIHRAIRSVLAQTHPYFELIVVNDGSTDNSFEEVRKISDPRIRIISQVNRGVAAARNSGVEKSQFEWVAFLDADDEWQPEFLEMISNLRDAFPACGLLASAFVAYREQGLDDSNWHMLPYPRGWQGVIQNFFETWKNAPFHISSATVKKDILVKIGGFPEFLHKGEDTNTWLRLYYETQFAFINEIGAVYHLDAENRSSCQPTLIGDDPQKPYSHALLVHELIRTKKIPANQIQAAIDYMALRDLPIASRLLAQGYYAEGLRRLWLYRHTKAHRKTWIQVLIIGFTPRFILSLYRHLRDQIINKSG